MKEYILLCFTFIAVLNCIKGLSRYCPLEYQVTASRIVTKQIECGFLGQRRCTQYNTENYQETLVLETNCCVNFTGANCDIPVCDPECTSPAPCIVEGDQTICYCGEGAQGETCDLAACSSLNNCFPGTCIGDTTDCACSEGYGGENCTNILAAGVMDSCEMKFVKYDGSTTTTLATYDCREESLETVYIMASDADYLDLDYTMRFDGPDTPPYPSYITAFKVGLIASSFSRTIVTPDNEITEEVTACEPETQNNEDPSPDSPYQILVCKDVRTVIDKAKLQHRGQFVVVFSTTSGGFKEFLDDQSQRISAYYTGIVSSFSRNLTFDQESPTHCTLTSDESCVTPCASYSDISTKPEVHTEWFGWIDEDSGITRYKFSVYKMSTGTDGRLTEVDLNDPMFSENLGADISSYIYTFVTSGMYSIRLEVFDKAGNTRSARSLVLFDPSSDIEVEENSGLIVDNTIAIENRLWFTSSSDPLVIHWQGRYVNRALHSNNWLKAVKDESGNLFDDTTGNRTVDEIPNKKGIVKFILKYEITSFDQLDANPDSLQIKMDSMSETFEISNSKEDGEAVRFFITAIDALGNEKIEMKTVHFDSTGAIFTAENTDMVINDDSADSGLPYTTRINLNLLDSHSGLQSISYTLYDVSGGIQEEIYSGTVEIQTPQIPQDCEATGLCYCLSFGPCYNRHQPVWIDHCQLTDRLDRNLELAITVKNGANIEKELSYTIGVLENPAGIGHYPPPTGINYQGDVPRVTITWVISPSCYTLDLIRLTISEDGITTDRDLTADARSYDLDTVKGTEYIIEIKTIYGSSGVFSSEGISFTTSGTKAEAVQGATTSQTDILTTTAVLGGIAVGGAIFLALVVLIIVMLVRKKQQKPVVPPVLREKAVRLRNNVSSRFSRMSQYFGRQSQAEEDEDEEKGVTTRDKSRRRRSYGFRLSKYSVQDGKTSHEGKKRRGKEGDTGEKERKKHGTNLADGAHQYDHQKAPRVDFPTDGQAVDNDCTNMGDGGRANKGVSFEEEDIEETKPPKSILKSVPETSEKESEKAPPAVTTEAPSDPSTSHALSSEVKKYGKMVVPKDADWLVSNEAYSLGNAVANTHSCSSEMRLATLRDQGSTSVVARTNRAGASYEDKMQMTALMNFMATEAPKHENIVAFMGAVPPTPKTAPILFFEYCDEGSLLSWVKETRNVTDEVEDQMINFAIHIATGLDHMHMNGMLHRKLRAAHILLKHSFANQMVAKVSGFGPENDTVIKDDEGEDATQRWVAPEQYEKPKLFTHKTDIWGYGVLLHEMFHMGKEPYSGMSVTEMKESVKSGFRMGKPKYGPEFMYDGVMKQCWQESQSDRPDFSELTNVMTAYFEGGKGEVNLDPDMFPPTGDLDITA